MLPGDDAESLRGATSALHAGFHVLPSPVEIGLTYFCLNHITGTHVLYDLRGVCGLVNCGLVDWMVRLKPGLGVLPGGGPRPSLDAFDFIPGVRLGLE
jgi:hypothetical protein